MFLLLFLAAGRSLVAVALRILGGGRLSRIAGSGRVVDLCRRGRRGGQVIVRGCGLAIGRRGRASGLSRSGGTLRAAAGRRSQVFDAAVIGIRARSRSPGIASRGGGRGTGSLSAIGSGRG